MDKLYEKLLELLGTVTEIKYIDLDYGQLQEEMPPLSYPAVLVRISESREDVDNLYQIVTGNITLTVINKLMGESNSLAPQLAREKGLAYMQLNEKIYKALQGYKDSYYSTFTNKSKADQLLRKGAKTVVQQWETVWRD
ncbi:hypothetical protein [Elizabethkingia anophelis]|uniref:hypothetical protein n=1 Tax=Elizabethkingia anophelis TaxID=1117645 RepID=UPI000976F323|nr:hypothetical protein [Elizabethkingia anophelis]